KEQTSHGCQQSMAYQVEVECVKPSSTMKSIQLGGSFQVRIRMSSPRAVTQVPWIQPAEEATKTCHSVTARESPQVALLWDCFQNSEALGPVCGMMRCDPIGDVTSPVNGSVKDHVDRDHVEVIAKVYIGDGTLEDREKGLSDGLDGGSVEEGAMVLM
ncbi:hypothetical protein STEG23_029046, partial [Scotinomys teguina]